MKDDEDTSMRYVRYHFFDTLFILLGSNQLYTLTPAELTSWEIGETAYRNKWPSIRVQHNS